MTAPVGQAAVAPTPLASEQAKLASAQTSQAPSDVDELRAVAEQFEALFAHMLLKNMRAASLGEGLFDSEQGDLYQDMMDQEMAQALSRRGGLGIADMLVAQLSPATVSQADQAHDAAAALQMPSHRVPAVPISATAAGRVSQTSSYTPLETHSNAPTRAPGPSETATSEHAHLFASPQAFVQAVWPLAQQAAATLRVSPHMILAQAALETGWGKHTIQREDGRQANNLFGIKANADWRGARVEVATTEVLGGVARTVVAPFRAYDSLAAGMGDYTRLLLSSPRYRDALNTRSDGAAFAQALQDGGYATDPQYAAKILAISRSETLNSALKGLKIGR